MAGFLSYSDVPRELPANILWRSYLWDRMRREPQSRDFIVASCKHDIAFYAASFVWSLDVRASNPCQPFIPYQFQAEYLADMVADIEKSRSDGMRHDIGTDKSRDMGVTTCIMILCDWYLRFGRNMSSLCISRKEDYVDRPEADDTLFAKLDFIEERLPQCLRISNRVRTRLNIANPSRKTQIKGESSNENAGRGGRNLFVFRDEEAFAENGELITKSCSQTTRCQIRVSTPNGFDNSFSKAKSSGKLKWHTFHWSRHPDKARGLYSIEGGRVEILDKDWHEKNPGYAFKIEPTHADVGSPWQFLRSPWFDDACAAADAPSDIAQELQIAYLGSGDPFFRQDTLQRIRSLCENQPVRTGSLADFLPESCREARGLLDMDFRPDKARSWVNFCGSKPPQDDTYCVAVDVAAGTGASDSVISVGSDRMRQKVWEFRTSGLTPENLAVACAAVVKLFTTEKGVPFLGWDQGGHGLPFGAKVQRLGCNHVFYYKPKDERAAKEARRAGLPSNRHIKLELFTDFRSALFNGEYVSPSSLLYDQLQEFVYDGAGGVVHRAEKTAEAASATGEQHGDVVMSEVILWHVMQRRPKPQPLARQVSPFSMAGRLAAIDKSKEDREGKRLAWVKN